MKHKTILGGTDARDFFRLAAKHATIVFPVLLLIFGMVVTSACVGFTGKTGLIPSIALEVTPNPIDFGSVMVGSSASQTLTVTNSGQGKFTLTTVSASGPGFTAGRFSPQTLASGQSVSLAVVFKPTVAGQENGNISVSIDSQGPQLVGSLKGAGSTTALTVNPSVVSFGNVNVGSPVTQSLRLSNSSSASVAIKSVSATGPEFGISGLTTPRTLTPNESVNFTAEFNPKAAGAETGTISIETGGTPLTVGLNGAGVSSAAQLVASAASLSFGSVTIGDTPSQQVTLKNTGNASADISSVSLTGNSYTLSGVTSNLVLSPDQSANLMVNFSPKTTGSLPGKVTISSNAAGSPLVIQFSGTGADKSQQHSVALNWDQGPSQVVGYFIYRGSKPSGPYTKLNAQATPEASYTDNSVVGGQTYYYVVTSVNSENIESAYSEQLSVTVPSS